MDKYVKLKLSISFCLQSNYSCALKSRFASIDANIDKGAICVVHSTPQRIDHWNGLRFDAANSPDPWVYCNIGDCNAEQLMNFIDAIEASLG